MYDLLVKACWAPQPQRPLVYPFQALPSLRIPLSIDRVQLLGQGFSPKAWNAGRCGPFCRKVSINLARFGGSEVVRFGD